MQSRKLRLSANHEHATPATATVANVRSKLIGWTPPVGTFYGVAQFVLPVLKLFKTGGDQVAGETRLYVGKQRPGDSSPKFADGAVDMYPFVDLSTALQRNADNAATLTVDLGVRIVLREEEELVIYAEGPDAVDPTEAGTAIELEVSYQTV